jgi:hypothetical protein
MAQTNESALEGDSNTGAEGKEPLRPLGILPIIIFYSIIGLVVVWKSDTVRNFLSSNRLLIGISFAIVLLGVMVAWLRSGGLTTSVKRQIGLTIFVAIPLLLALVMAVSLMPDTYTVPALRSVFLLIACLLPATMYYLFIFSRKYSLLQEFLTNLSRLGLFGLQRRGGGSAAEPQYESELVRQVRIMSYIQKFEAVYGPIPEGLAGEIIAATNPANPTATVPNFQKYSAGGALTSIFTSETTIPVVLATLLIGLGWLLTLPPWEIIPFQEETKIADKLLLVLQPNKIAVHFAFLGAYFFSLQMLFRRYVRKDLRANAYMAVSLRIILAVIGAWVVIHAAAFLGLAEQPAGDKAQVLLVIGFVIGAFPPIAWQVIQTAFRTVTGAKFFVPSLRSVMPVSELDGLTVWHEARLEEEDIENVPNMATADLVELMLHTRVPPDRIVDWVDQALLYTQIGPDKKSDTAPEKKGEGEQAVPTSPRERLGEHGIRTASALIAAYDKSRKENDVGAFENILPGATRSRIRSLVDTLSTNPNLILVQQWRCLPIDR